MQKRIAKALTAAALALLCLVSAGCSSVANDVPQNMQLASPEDANYAMYVPKSWILNTDGGFASAYYSAADPSNVSLFLFSPEEAMSIEEYWAVYKEKYKEAYPSMEVIEESNRLIGGRNAGKYVFTANLSGKDYKFMQLITVYSGAFYIFTYTATPENYDAHTEELEEIIENFVFK